MIAASGVTAAQAEHESAVRSAIAAAVEQQTDAAGVTLDIRVVEIPSGVSPDAADVEAGARFGRPSRFRLRAGERSIGYAVAVVHGSSRHLTTTRAVRAGETIAAGDLQEVATALGGLPVEPLPGAAQVVGGTTTRALAAGEAITSRLVRMPPAVRSGDVVSMRVVVEGVEAVGVATALQSGNVGDVIRLVNPESRRQLRGRITGKASVEVQNES
jgi:flagella basal body P-ring formation protein FlgA